MTPLRSKEKSILRKVLKALNGSIKVISKLERDPPITAVAVMQMNDVLSKLEQDKMEEEIMKELGYINGYRKEYWSIEKKIKQGFISEMKIRGYLPANSREIVSLKNSLPIEMIKGDDRLWVYSFDHYIGKISDQVGRSEVEAPSGREIWDRVSKRNIKDIKRLLRTANKVLPRIYVLKAKITAYLKNDTKEWDDIKVKSPRLTLVERPLKKTMMIKRPIPLPRNRRKPRRKILKKPQVKTIGPEDFN